MLKYYVHLNLQRETDRAISVISNLIPEQINLVRLFFLSESETCRTASVV